MLRRPAPEPLSPRALARLRASPRSWVPSALDLEREPRGADPDRDDRRGDDRPSDHEARTAPRPGPVGAGRRWADDASDLTSPAARHARVAHPRRWVRMPAAFVGARWQPGRAALFGLVVVLVVAVAVFGLRVAWAQSVDSSTVIAPGGGSRAGPTGVTAGAVPVGVAGSAGGGSGVASPTASAAGVASSGGVVVVHVVGRVRHPGVRQLPVGSRVTDAVTAAGGAATKADLSALNLARVLVDGEQLRVPALGDPAVALAPTGVAGGAGGAGGSGTSTGPVSLNVADLAALDTLPGVGPVLAQRILDWRAAHGRFTSIDELGEVSGIGEKLLAQLTPLVSL